MKIDKEQLIKLKKAGRTDAECARVFGCTTKAVQNMIKRMGEARIREKQIAVNANQQTAPAENENTVAERLEEAEHIEQIKPEEEITVAPPAPIEPLRKYPAGVQPRQEWLRERWDDIRRAICEHAVEGLYIDPAWVEEYNELVGVLT